MRDVEDGQMAGSSERVVPVRGQAPHREGFPPDEVQGPDEALLLHLSSFLD